MARLALCLSLSILAQPAIAMPSGVDSVHAHMEPPPPYPKRPFVRHPLGAQLQGSGLIAAAGRLVTRKRLLALLPAAIVTASFTYPGAMERLLLHVICIIGSLFEPFDSVLPKRSPLRFFIKAVQDAKRAYDVKHGLVSIDDQTFFDEEDSPPLEEEQGDAVEGEEESGEADAAGAELDESAADVATE